MNRHPMAAEADRIAEEVSATEKDAARYRWLRKSHERSAPGVFHPAFVARGNRWIRGDELDAAIDAASP